MAGKFPTFITGANARIKVNGVTLAFCTNVSYVITVNHASPVVLGMYESSSLEALSYKVSGSFSVIRYVADAVVQERMAHGTVIQGNGIGTWSKKSTPLDKMTTADDGRVYDNLNPEKLEKACGFDIEIAHRKSMTVTATLAKIRNCRITQASLQLGVKSTANQTFNFIGIYADEDSFLSSASGSGQQFA